MKYIITEPLSTTVMGGVPIKLTPEQLAHRRHLVLPAAAAGFHLPAHPFEFKPGEVLETQGELRGLESLVQPLGDA